MGTASDRYEPIDGPVIHLICAICKEVVTNEVSHACLFIGNMLNTKVFIKDCVNVNNNIIINKKDT